MRRTVTALTAIAITTAGFTTRTSIPDYRPPVGALNPVVTQATIKQTICVSGWTATIRPTSAYTTKLKAKQMKARHLPGRPADYEEDHFIPLELGGAPTNPANLWPQPWPAARTKDHLETSLKSMVCAGTTTLAAARRAVTVPPIP